MIRLLLALLLLAAVAGLASAAEETGRRPGEGKMWASETEADDLPIEGLALDLVASSDSNHFKRIITRASAMLNYVSVYDFVALGVSSNLFRQGDWSLRANSLLTMVRKVEKATAEGYTARIALAEKANGVTLHGEGVWNIRLTPSTGVELIANRDAVESEPALRSGLMVNLVAVSLDHALSERLTLIGMPVYRRFSDGNEQHGWRAWVIYGLAPEHGLSLSLKARAYGSSQNGGGAYFSPDHYQRAEIGLRLRHSVGNWRLFGTADVGRERIDQDTVKPTLQFSLSAQRSFGNNASVGVQVATLRSSDSVSNTGGADAYTWRMARVFVTIPF